jgi:mono/diheme cytochrome c family protein
VKTGVRGLLALVVVAVMGCAIAGVGMGESAAQRAPAPSAAAIAAAKQRIAVGGATVRRGRELFTAQGCDRCHSIAAIGADGKLGPRLDTVDAKLEDNLESISDPRHDIREGYPEHLMPTDFADRLNDADLQALAAFVTAASGGERDGGGNSGKGGGGNSGKGGGDSSGKGSGKGRGRGRSGGG